MSQEYRSDDWNEYRMSFKDPHQILEPLEKEIAVVDGALNLLQERSYLPRP